MRQIVKRWAFILLSTTIMVFFSEKMYWYTQGYAYAELVLFYMPGTYIFLLAVSYFRVRGFWAMFLAASLYPLYVEGALTGIIVADITGIMFFYFIGWHTTLSVIFGWYFQHKLLVQQRIRALALSSAAMGFLLGIWATVFWIPENVNDPELIAEGHVLGQWPIADYALLLLYLGVIYTGSHYLLGRFWDDEFRPSRLENVLVILYVLFLVSLQLITYTVLGVTFVVLCILILISLRRYSAERKTVLSELGGGIRFADSLVLFLLPVFAVIGYAMIAAIRPPDSVIKGYGDLIIFVQLSYGVVLFLYSVYKVLRTDVTPDDSP